jgi:zinc/manganese transport system substrate-binding protein
MRLNLRIGTLVAVRTGGLSALALRASAALALRASAALALGASCVLALAIAGCGGIPSTGPNGRVLVVAAESFWGSIAAQLAGSKASVLSIIADPAQDPHSYEPKPADARAMAMAQFAIVNGVGYDPWAPKLLSANPASGRVVLNVGDLFGLKDGDNPHRWYDPDNVEAVANSITADLKKLDAKDAAYFDRLHASFEQTRLARYHALITSINKRYSGVPVGASESIFALLAPALGLKLITPNGFLKAISEGTELTAQDRIRAEQQITTRQIKVWIYNSQNATPDIQRLDALSRARGIPIATVTETLQPAGASFEQWQVAQLEAIARALHQATGR